MWIINREDWARKNESQTRVLYERVNNRNTTLINAHNGMIGRINVAAGILEDMLDNKPKHMLARDANGKVMGSDREALLRVLSCLKIEPKKSDDDEEVEE